MKKLLSLTLSLALLVLLAGCGENLMVPEPVSSEINQVTTPGGTASKARHMNMMEDALQGGRDAAGKGKESLGLIINVGKQSIVERYKVLERYKLIERYRLIERYEYNDIIGGFAIWLEDTFGLADYNEFLSELEADPDIEWYEPDFTVELPAETLGNAGSSQVIPWSVAAIGGETSWAASGDGSGSVDVDVYVVDTGVAKASSSDPDDDLVLYESIDFLEGLDASDPDGHGTHIAAIIGAIDDDDGTVGVAPGARIHNMRVLGDDGTADMSVVLAAIDHITAAKKENPSNPIVVNLSLGEYMGNEDATALDDAINASIDLGVHYVVAAGNQALNASFATPAKVQRALTVGSYDINGVFSGFSNFGPKVDILAPGEGIVSMSKNGGSTTTMTGTSMAAAHVTGAVALYVARNPRATPAQAMAAVLAKAEAFVVGAPDNTTGLSVWVGEEGLTATAGTTISTQSTDGSGSGSDATTNPATSATAATPPTSALPVFLQYAVFAYDKLELEEVTIGERGAQNNANVHANEEIKADDDDGRVFGFGTSAGKVDGDPEDVFFPNVNPDQRASHGFADFVDMDKFEAKDYLSLATEVVDSNLKLETDYNLGGTAASPTLLFVDGNVRIDDDIRMTGYGIIFATGNIDFRDDVSTEGPGEIGFFSTGNIDVEGNVEANLVSGGDITIEDGRVTGSVAAYGQVKAKEDATVIFRALSARLAGLFW